MLKLSKNIDKIIKCEEGFFFFGDSSKNSQARGPEADIKIVEEYIKECEEQIKLAKEYLKNNKKEEK